MTELDKGALVSGQFHCIASEVEGKSDCASSNALRVYEHEDDNGTWYDASCFSCNQGFNRGQFADSSLATTFGIKEGAVVKKKFTSKVKKTEPITNEQIREFWNSTTFKSNNYRGIKDKYSEFYGHRVKLGNDGKVISQYYPEFQDDEFKLTGYKCRNHPKDFRYGNIGKTGMSSQLSGQNKFKEYQNNRDLLIVGGECDKAAAYQMLREYQISRNQSEYAAVAVVSPTTGEGSAFKQIQSNYDFVTQFENIIIGMDNDEAGIAATEKIVEVLPKDKLKVVSWTGGDPNKMLLEGNQKQFLSDFFGAKAVITSKIIESTELDQHMIDEIMIEKVSLPSYMWRLEKALAGGISRGVIVNVIGVTKQGKTTHTNEMLYYWLFNSPELLGVMSLELSRGQYGVVVLSRHVGRNINKMFTPEEKLEFINSPEIVEKRNELWKNEFGGARWYLLDDRDSNIEEVKAQCETLYRKYGCRQILIDPLQDLIGGLSNEQQEDFMRWQKNFIKNGVTLINVCHTNKSSSENRGNGKPLRELSPDDVQGTSAVAKSGGLNLYLMRDTYSECPIMRNVTHVKGECRWSSWSGWAGKWYYDPETHTSYDFQDYFTEHPEKLPDGFDWDYNPFEKKQDKPQQNKFTIPKKDDIVEDFVTMPGNVKL